MKHATFEEARLEGLAEEKAPPADSAIDHPCADDGTGVCKQCGAPCDEHPVIPGARAGEVEFIGVALVLDYETDDGRIIESGDFSWRNTPLPLMYQDTNPAFGGHEGAFLIGRIEDVALDSTGRRVWMRGNIDPNASDRAEKIVETLRSQTARFVSVDLAGADIEYEVRSVDEEGWPMDVLARFSRAVMAGATVTPFPAISDAVIWLKGEQIPFEASAPLPDPPERVLEPEVKNSGLPPMPALMASAIPSVPPMSWFTDPGLAEPTPFTIDDDGRAYGHLALWGVCHIGLGGCVTAPHSESEYAYFRTGATRVRCDCEEPECEEIIELATGVLTLGTSHAGLALDGPHALAHYEDTGIAACDLAAGEDAHGIWIAGAARSHLSDDQLRRLRAASPSGDWRRIGGSLELVATLGVNVPGFPVPRTQSRLVASADTMVQTALVAPADPRLDALVAGGRSNLRISHEARTVTVDREAWTSLHARLRRVEAIAEPLAGQAAQALRASIN